MGSGAAESHPLSPQRVVLDEALQAGKESFYPKHVGANCSPFQNGRGKLGIKGRLVSVRSGVTSGAGIASVADKLDIGQ